MNLPFRYNFEGCGFYWLNWRPLTPDQSIYPPKQKIILPQLTNCFLRTELIQIRYVLFCVLSSPIINIDWHLISSEMLLYCIFFWLGETDLRPKQVCLLPSYCRKGLVECQKISLFPDMNMEKNPPFTVSGLICWTGNPIRAEFGQVEVFMFASTFPGR